jgi:hypothetical protein
VILLAGLDDFCRLAALWSRPQWDMGPTTPYGRCEAKKAENRRHGGLRFPGKGLSAQNVIVAKQLSRPSSVLAMPMNVVGVADGKAVNVRTTVNDPLGRVLVTPE